MTKAPGGNIMILLQNSEEALRHVTIPASVLEVKDEFEKD